MGHPSATSYLFTRQRSGSGRAAAPAETQFYGNLCSAEGINYSRRRPMLRSVVSAPGMLSAMDATETRPAPMAKEPWYSTVAYSILDVFFALYNRAWPLTLALYTFFAVPLEVAFHIHTHRYRHVRSKAPNCMFMGWQDAREARRCWTQVLTEDSPEAIERGLRSWFTGKGELGWDDVASVMSIFIYNVRYAALLPADREVVATMVSMVEAVLGKRMAAGRNPNLRCLATYVFDGLDECNKPLVYYLYMQTLEGVIWWVYRRLGFELRCTHSSQPGVQNLQVRG